MVSPALLGMSEPEILSAPPSEVPALHITAGTRVRLVHPWMMDSAAFDGMRVGVIHLPFHRQFPWSASRWRFVMRRLQEVTEAIFVGDMNELGPVLSQSVSVESVATLNPGYRDALPALCARLHESVRRFPNPVKACRSFSAFWSICTQGSEDAPRRAWHR